MPETPAEHITPRQQGCEAVPDVKGTDFSLPVCMGGTALVGCNNPDKCEAVYIDKVRSPFTVHMIMRTADQSRVKSITTVSRQPILDNSSS